MSLRIGTLVQLNTCQNSREDKAIDFLVFTSKHITTHPTLAQFMLLIPVKQYHHIEPTKMENGSHHFPRILI